MDLIGSISTLNVGKILHHAAAVNFKRNRNSDLMFQQNLSPDNNSILTFRIIWDTDFVLENTDARLHFSVSPTSLSCCYWLPGLISDWGITDGTFGCQH